ncbi:hypothetical protein BJV82DRAFT_671595 [Fennellomyces sp. T-0311]|nr:hypothetical protein BJV82DRAFT_671595 [Fennellomyces sp. T-0311]
MKFAYTPPKEIKKGDFPVLGEVVTIENCFYYLSLMERFLRYKDSFDSERLKAMLARSELRYIKWRDIIETSPKDSHIFESFVPPLDVAYMWHAHMLSPFRYFEDAIRLGQMKMYKKNFPLAALHQSLFTGVTAAVDCQWRQFYGYEEPYILTLENVMSGTTTLPCSFCTADMECSWYEYTHWRHNPGVGIKCQVCLQDTTLSTASMARLNYDIEERAFLIAGTLLLPNGAVKSKYELKLQKALVHCVQEAVDQLPEGRLVTPSRSVDELVKLIERFCEDPHSLSQSRAKAAQPLGSAIRSCYHNNPSPFSLDLIQAVGRQHEFNYKATNMVNWQVPYGTGRAIRQYFMFLKIMVAYENQIMVPTLEIDLAWHTHMLHPQPYRAFTFKHITAMINHDDTISPETLREYADGTDKAWLNSLGHNLINNRESAENRTTKGSSFMGRFRKAMTIGFGSGDYYAGTLPDPLTPEMLRQAA